MMNAIFRTAALALALAAVTAQFSQAAVSEQEAAKLKTTLTPLGGERSGNKDGTIPAWEGGYTSVAPGWEPSKPRPDPFAAEKPMLSITAKNASQYADKLSDGELELFKRYPETYRIDVYPTHRTAAAPQWVYDNTFKNATRARTRDGGINIEGAFGGIPFPIPQDGAEVMWNNDLAWAGETNQQAFYNYSVTSDGKLTKLSRGLVIEQSPYYSHAGSGEGFAAPLHEVVITTSEPPFKAGEALLIHDFMDRGSDAWMYLSGQRRVRKAPTVGYDTPNDVNSGVENYDDVGGFIGRLDRYDWKLLGKKEMFVPYNANRFHGAAVEDVAGPHHVNPDAVRWERHRVWVVEATLAAGKRHTVPKRRFYVDEDTWGVLMADGWDARGQLQRHIDTMPLLAPEGPCVLPRAGWVSYNLISNSWAITGKADFAHGGNWQAIARRPDSFFTPEAIAAAGR